MGRARRGVPRQRRRNAQRAAGVRRRGRRSRAGRVERRRVRHRSRGRAARSTKTRRCDRSRPTPPARSRPTTSRCRRGSAQAAGAARRAFNHLGPGQLPRFVAPALAERIARNELDGGTVVPVGNLSARRDFTDVRDVVRAYRLLVERGEPGEAYNVCSGRAVSVQQLAEALLTHGAATDGAEARSRARASGRRARAPRRLLAASEATGWEPEIALDQTLADLLDDMRARSGLARSTRPDRGARLAQQLALAKVEVVIVDGEQSRLPLVEHPALVRCRSCARATRGRCRAARAAARSRCSAPPRPEAARPWPADSSCRRPARGARP